jgi:hypothetical protein
MWFHYCRPLFSYHLPLFIHVFLLILFSLKKSDSPSMTPSFGNVKVAVMKKYHKKARKCHKKSPKFTTITEADAAFNLTSWFRWTRVFRASRDGWRWYKLHWVIKNWIKHFRSTMWAWQKKTIERDKIPQIEAEGGECVKTSQDIGNRSRLYSRKL